MTDLEKVKNLLNEMNIKFVESECKMHISHKDHHHFELIDCTKIAVLNEEKITKDEKIPFTLIKSRGNFGLYIYFYKETEEILQIIA